jgi:hypothetical protein
MRPRTARAVLLTATALGALTGSSCQPGQRFHPVRGQVWCDDQPAAGALVVFHPANDPDPQAIRPSAYVLADGSFTLQSFDRQGRASRDGAPAGEYRVTVSWFPPNAGRYTNVIPDKLQGRYSNPKTSGLRADVKEGDNEIPPFRLHLQR